MLGVTARDVQQHRLPDRVRIAPGMSSGTSTSHHSKRWAQLHAPGQRLRCKLVTAAGPQRHHVAHPAAGAPAVALLWPPLPVAPVARGADIAREDAAGADVDSCLHSPPPAGGRSPGGPPTGAATGRGAGVQQERHTPGTAATRPPRSAVGCRGWRRYMSRSRRPANATRHTPSPQPRSSQPRPRHPRDCLADGRPQST